MKLIYLISIVTAMILVTAGISIVLIQYPFDADIINKNIAPGDDELEPLGNMSFQDAVNAFSFNVFNELSKNSNDNIFISPYSIFTALAMTYEGANSTTAEEMAAVLNIEQDNASFHNYVKTMYDTFNAKNETYNISTANALWVKENLQLLNTYLSIIQTYYGGEATDLDFSQPSEAASIINSWVENQTNGFIKDLVPESAIDPMTGLILTNAIYFKGVWLTQFDPENTTNLPFDTFSDGTVDVPMMRLINTEDFFYYTETDEIQILELPYDGDDLCMQIILPKEKGIDGIIEDVNIDLYTEWSDSLEETPVNIYLPKFTVETSYSLKEYLTPLGMHQAFLPTADFSGITGARDLFIDEVLHKAYVEVNEEGTEAAGATAVIMKLTAVEDGPSRVEFRCDHPFLFLIQHKGTGTILFMGSITNPTN